MKSFSPVILLAAALLALSACEPGSPLPDSRLPSLDGGGSGDGSGSTPGSPTAPGPTGTTRPTSKPTPKPTTTSTPTPTSPPTAGTDIPAPLFGVTVTSTGSLSSITQSLQSLSRKPTARVVFDEFVAASTYKSAVASIHNVAYVMGEILDSLYVKQYTLQAYKDRTTEYLDALGDNVDIWEVGNEINGEWVGTASDVSAKMAASYDLVKARGKRAALTLYYNGPADSGQASCWQSSSNQMFNWAQANVPARMKSGLDYVLISFYDDDCPSARPDWQAIFTQLHAMFPNSRIGMGEIGTQVANQKAAFIDKYYTQNINVPGFIGGYFWWWFNEDMVPATKTSWGTLNQSIITASGSAGSMPNTSAGRAHGFDRVSDQSQSRTLISLAIVGFALGALLASSAWRRRSRRVRLKNR